MKDGIIMHDASWKMKTNQPLLSYLGQVMFNYKLHLIDFLIEVVSSLGILDVQKKCVLGRTSQLSKHAVPHAAVRETRPQLIVYLPRKT